MYNIIMKQAYEDPKSLISPQIRIRCPYCFQIFKAFTKEFEEEMPDFQCTVCRETFWIDIRDKSQVVLGKPGDMQKSRTPPPLSGLGVSTKVCPRCTEEVPIADQECSHCGVVFIKIIERGDSSFQLRIMWAKVIKNWHNEQAHDRFLRACRKQDELAYGMFCYGRILKEDKNNRKAQEMIKRMESLTWFFEEELSLPKLTFKKVMNKVGSALQSYAMPALILSCILFFLTYVFFF